VAGASLEGGALAAAAGRGGRGRRLTHSDLPETAAWRHLDARAGFEVLFLSSAADGHRFDGQSTAVEDGEAWGIRYTLELDTSWTTRSAHIVGRSSAGRHEVRLERDGSGEWSVDGEPAPELAGCLDVDLEASAFTNAFPVHRLGLDVGQRASAPAAWVRAPDLRVERLEQSYARLEDDAGRSSYDYAAPALDFTCVIVYDEFGLVLDYPGIAVRVA
jgi:uncharacterized protein